MSRHRTPNRRRPARRGHTLIEILACLMLWAVFATVAFRVVGGVFRTYDQTRRADDAAARLDAAMTLVRSDVASAAAVDLVGDHGLLVHSAAADDVRWAADRGTWTRTAGPTSRTWPVGRPLSVRREGDVLLVQPSADPADAIPFPVGGDR